MATGYTRHDTDSADIRWLKIRSHCPTQRFEETKKVPRRLLQTIRGRVSAGLVRGQGDAVRLSKMAVRYGLPTSGDQAKSNQNRAESCQIKVLRWIVMKKKRLEFSAAWVLA